MPYYDFRCAGPFVRAVLLMIGSAVLVLTSTRLVSPNGATLDIHLAPLPSSQVSGHMRSRRHHPAKLFAGVASWYGDVFEGHTTASGEVFHKDRLTACHPTLPFGTLVRVINLRNSRSVIVRINDRGQLYPGRVIDLSLAAAERIGMLDAGVAPVRLEVIRDRG